MLSMKGVGQGFVFVGVVCGLDGAGMRGYEGEALAAVGTIAMLLGVVLIRRSKPKS